MGDDETPIDNNNMAAVGVRNGLQRALQAALHVLVHGDDDTFRVFYRELLFARRPFIFS
ncbi:MAG: hypothetical protein ABJA98_31500 [Acidobacteriota bacterium]